MRATLSESIEITARALFNRSGSHAIDEALRQATYLKKNGDEEGHDVWTEVAKVISGYNLDQIDKNPE